MKFRRISNILFATALAASSLTLLDACGGAGGSSHSAKVKPADMPSGASWTGVYFNPVYGMLHLVHTGSNMEGKWKRADGSAWGELNGPVTGNVFHFEWTEHRIGMVGPSATTKGRGYFVYKRPPGDNVDDTLSGEWGLATDETGNQWDCVKQRNVQPDLKSIGESVEAGGPSGDWQ